MIGKSAGRVEEIGGQIETIQNIAYRSVRILSKVLEI